MSADILTGFRAAISERGLEPHEIIPDGELHRCTVRDGKRGNRDGAYVLHLDGIPAGGFQNWADGQGWQDWCDRRKTDVPRAEWDAHLARMAEDRKRREAKLVQERAAAAKLAQQIWNESAPRKSHPYLTRKKVEPHGLRTTTRDYDLICSDGEKTMHVPAGTLVVPLCDSDCKLHTLAFTDVNGGKKFLPGGHKQGHFYVLGDPGASKAICIAEGYATSATIFETTGFATFIAFDCGNLEPVARTVRKEFPNSTSIVCADDDHHIDGNPGLAHATKAAQAVGGLLVVPDFGDERPDDATDFNDLARLRGAAEAKKQIDAVFLSDKTAKTAKTATANAETERWPAPQPLVASVAREPYPVPVLPPVFREAIAEVQAFVQAPVAMVSMSAIGAASIAVQALVNVERAEGLAGPTGLFSLALAPSGERKSSIDGYFTKPIRDYELAESEKGEPLVKAFKADLGAWEAKKRGLEKKIEEAIKKGKDTEDDEERLRNVAQSEPKPPLVPQLLYTDATMEALAYGLAKDWPSGGILSSEAGSVFGAHSMGRETIMRTLALWNTCWDGGSMRIHRRTAGSSYWLRNARLTMNLQVQPDVLLDFLTTDRGLSRGSGFLARILLAYPESTQGSRRYREPPKSWPALARFNKRITAILNMPVNIDEHSGLTPVVLPLTSEAHGAWIKFHNRIESELKIGGTLCDVRDVASKIADNACRIAAILQVFEYGVGAVGLPAFEAGACIAEWHLTEARRFFGEVAMPEENAEAAMLDSWLLAYCREGGISSVPVSTIQKAGPSKLRGKVALESTISALEELGRARLVKGEGKAKVVEINPALLAVAVIAVNAVIAQSAKKAVI